MTVPVLPLGSPIDGNDIPVASIADITAAFPDDVNDPVPAPVRDAIQAGLLAYFAEYQRRASYAAAQSDPLRATDIYIQGLGADDGVFGQANETDANYRARINAPPATVTPAAIIAAANAILAPFTAISARYVEQLDGWFVGDGTQTWMNGIYDGTQNRTPYYPDRLYSDDAAANGTSIPARAPGGCRVFGDSLGRYFELRVPDLAALDANVAAVGSSDPTLPATTWGLFIGDGTSALNTSFINVSSDGQYDAYQSIINSVERIKGMSIRWQLFVDPQLIA